MSLVLILNFKTRLTSGIDEVSIRRAKKFGGLSASRAFHLLYPQAERPPFGQVVHLPSGISEGQPHSWQRSLINLTTLSFTTCGG